MHSHRQADHVSRFPGTTLAQDRADELAEDAADRAANTLTQARDAIAAIRAAVARLSDQLGDVDDRMVELRIGPTAEMFCAELSDTIAALEQEVIATVEADGQRAVEAA